MTDTRDPHETPATTIGNGSRRPSVAAPAAGVRRIDVGSQDQVYDLARVMRTASTRRLMQVTHAELRAVAGLAADSAALASQAQEYLRLLAAKAPADEVQARLEAMAATAGVQL